MNKTKFHFPTFIAVIFTAAILIGSFVWFSKKAGAMMSEDAKFYLESNAKSQAAVLGARLENLLDVLEHAGTYWSDVDMNDFDAVSAKIRDISVPKNFISIAVADFKGRMVDNFGNETADISKLPCFQRARSGERVISDMKIDGGSGGDFLYMAVPIWGKARVLGVILGRLPISLLSGFIHIESFQETCEGLLLTDDGTIIARSCGDCVVTDRIANFYDLGSSWGINDDLSLTEIKIDMINEQTFTVPYKSGARNRLSVLTPVGKNGWYYAVVFSQDVIRLHGKKISLYMTVIIIAIVIAFAMLFITILHLTGSAAFAEETNDRFRVATTQAQAIVFDYDFQKRRLVLNGNVRVIDKNAREAYPGDEIKEILRSILHENDLSVIAELDSLRHTMTNSISRELRIRCTDGAYYWHRLTGTVVRDDDGSPLRLVGNFINVEDEMNKELQLKRRAEVDVLSGLLNKTAFTSRVTRILSESTPDNLYAFYLIDLDNFKKVNDTLGHIVGDLVISDVAQKLCTVFSENDFVSRIGGDEFAAFLKLSGSGIQMGRKIIEAKALGVCSIVEDTYSNEDSQVSVSASIGVSLFPSDGHSFDELYQSACDELKKSKNMGKNQYHICKLNRGM